MRLVPRAWGIGQNVPYDIYVALPSITMGLDVFGGAMGRRGASRPLYYFLEFIRWAGRSGAAMLDSLD